MRIIAWLVLFMFVATVACAQPAPVAPKAPEIPIAVKAEPVKAPAPVAPAKVVIKESKVVPAAPADKKIRFKKKAKKVAPKVETKPEVKKEEVKAVEPAAPVKK